MNEGVPPPPTRRAPAHPALYVAPKTPIEETLAGLWAELLGIPRVGLHDDVFALGATERHAAELALRLDNTFQVDLTVDAIRDAPTVALLAVAVGQAALVRLRAARQQAPRVEKALDLQRIPRRTDTGPAALSFAQERLWFLDQWSPGSPLYNIPVSRRLGFPVDTDLLRRALEEVVRRHEVLRTTFRIDRGTPVQDIHRDASVPIEVVPAGAVASEADLLRLLVERTRRPFDLSRDVMIRATVIRFDQGGDVVLLVTHHIASDAWSMGILFHELIALYEAFASGTPSPLPELPIQYADFAAWQRQWMAGDNLARQLAYWKKHLDGLATLEVPTDRPRPPVPSYRGGAERRLFPPALLDALTALGRERGSKVDTTLFMTLLGAFQALLARYTGQDDVVIGSPIAGRTRSEIEPLIGFFVNTLVLRTDLSGDPTFREILARVRQVAFGAFTHQDVPFEKLVEELRPDRDTSRSPLFQVAFTMLNAHQPARPRHVEAPRRGRPPMRPVGVHSGTAKFDLTLSLSESDDGLGVTMEYAADLFDATTIERMIGHLGALLEGVAADPSLRLKDLPLLTAPERRQLLEEWNDPKADYRREATLHGLFEAQAARTPEAVAVTFEASSLTYRELDERANQLAHYLRKRGVGPDVLVGICTDRSLEMIIGVLGILKAGGAYVPLDPTYPRDRLAFMVEDSRIRVLVTHDPHFADLPAGDTPLVDRVRLDADRAAIDAEPSTSVPVAGSPDDLAYVIYTSGSTGKPKGALVSHANVTRLFAATDAWYGFGPADVWTVFHSYAFDFSVWEIWGALLYGGRTVVVPYWVCRSPAAYYKLLLDEQVTVLNQTPSAFRQLLEAETAFFDSGAAAKSDRALALRYVVFGGEALDLASLAPWFARHGDARPQLVNMYGITETTVHVTYRPLTTADLDKGWSSAIGRPIPDLRVYLLDPHLSPVPIGVRGEMYVGGAGVSRGYLNRPELAAQRFLADPFSRAAGARLYRTGDLGRYLPDGQIEYLGRIDHQVKVRGYRIELGEIEAVLAQHPAAGSVLVIPREDTPGDQRLVAYLTPGRESTRPTTHPTTAELRAHLKAKLPDYMVPAAFLWLDAFPMTSNGKIDRKALPSGATQRSSPGSDFVAPAGALELQLTTIFENLLGVTPVGTHDNFFDLGGHSLLAVRLLAEIEKACGKALPLASLFQAQTVAELAILIHKDYDPSAWSTITPIQPSGSRHPFFCVSRPNVNSLGYVALARHLGRDQPVYGLQSTFREEVEGPYEPSEYATLADRYIKAMRRVQPEGPYFIGGMCEGAHIAFEMVRRLEAEGHRIGMFAIFDAWAVEHTRVYALWRFNTYRSRLYRRAWQLGQLGQALPRALLGKKAPAEQEAHATPAAKPAPAVAPVSAPVAPEAAPSEDPPIGLPEPELGAPPAIMVRTHERFKQRYFPENYAPTVLLSPITVFRIREQEYYRIQDPQCGWGKRSVQAVEVHLCTGTHKHFLREPFVRDVALKLNACLLRAGIDRKR